MNERQGQSRQAIWTALAQSQFASAEGDVVLHFLLPKGSRSEDPDEMFADQQAALSAAGFTTSTCSDAVLAGVKPLRGVPALVTAIERCDSVPFTSRVEYLAAHHLPNWYPLIADLTPETRIYATGVDIEGELRALGWGAYFLKDYVKSLKTARGSVVHNPADAPAVIAEMLEYRGRIEGGLCVRRVEEFVADSERRYFVLRGVPYSSSGADSVPDVVRQCAERIPSPFFSADVVLRSDGQLRVVEVGDGQVSDLVGWAPIDFAAIWHRAGF